MENVNERPKLPRLLHTLQHVEFPHKLGFCEKFFARRLEELGICWVKTAPGPVWKLDLRNSTHRWIVYGHYEGLAFFNWIRNHLREEPVIVDSGANIGQMTLYFGTYFPKARILAFEPGKHQTAWLSECLSRNSALPVKLFPYALGTAEDTMYLHLTGHASSHGSQNVVTTDVGEIPIHVVPLSQVLTSEQIDIVDLWKLDVEGFELPALRGAATWLQAKTIRALWIETREENGIRIAHFMREMGYNAFDLSVWGKAIPTSECNRENTLFLPER